MFAQEDKDADIVIPKKISEELFIPNLYVYHLIKFEPLEFIEEMDFLLFTPDNRLG